MLERKKLNKFVIMTLKNSEINIKACTLYHEIRSREPGIMRQEGVKGFRSFVKVLNSFENVKSVGSGVKRYTIKNGITK